MIVVSSRSRGGCRHVLPRRDTNYSSRSGARHGSGIAGVLWGRLAACAAVGFRRSWPNNNRPRLIKRPQRGVPALAYTLRSDSSRYPEDSLWPPLLCRKVTNFFGDNNAVRPYYPKGLMTRRDFALSCV